jgi:hypothetical protein
MQIIEFLIFVLILFAVLIFALILISAFVFGCIDFEVYYSLLVLAAIYVFRSYMEE